MDSQPRAHMEGIFHRSLPDLNGGGSALVVPLTDTQFHFPAGNKLSHPFGHLLLRTVDYSQEGT